MPCNLSSALTGRRPRALRGSIAITLLNLITVIDAPNLPGQIYNRVRLLTYLAYVVNR